MLYTHELNSSCTHASVDEVQQLDAIAVRYMVNTARAIDYDAVRAAYNLLKECAERECAVAMVCLARFCINGYGAPRDDNAAFKWYQAAENLGHAPALSGLYMCYRDGLGVAKCGSTAFVYCKQAAKQGNVDMQFFLAQHYDHGDITKKNAARSLKWYLRAAPHDPDAKFNAAICYQRGLGTPVDRKKAFDLFTELAALPVQDGTVFQELGFCYSTGVGVDRDSVKAFELYQQSAALGHVFAKGSLAHHYYYGQGCAQDKARAIELYKCSAEAGHAPHQYRLGCILFKNDATQAEALMWLRRAVAQRDLRALDMLVRYYDHHAAYRTNYVMKTCLREISRIWKGIPNLDGVGVRYTHWHNLLWYETPLEHDKGRFYSECAIEGGGKQYAVKTVETRNDVTAWLIEQHPVERSLLLDRRTTLQAVITAVFSLLPMTIADEVTPHIITLTAFVGQEKWVDTTFGSALPAVESVTTEQAANLEAEPAVRSAVTTSDEPANKRADSKKRSSSKAVPRAKRQRVRSKQPHQYLQCVNSVCFEQCTLE